MPTVREVAERRPGELFKAGLKEMATYLTGRSGARLRHWAEGQVLAYLNQVVFAGTTPKEMGERNTRELRTLAELMDALLEGDLPRVGDLAMQRFEAVEMAVAQGSWAQARHVEAIPTGNASLANTRVKELAMAGESRSARLLQAVDKARNRGGAQD